MHLRAWQEGEPLTDQRPSLDRQVILAALLTVVALMVSSCGDREERSKDKYEFIEFVGIEGTCVENHVREPARYTGSLVHWRKVTQQEDRRYGSVHRRTETEEMVKQIEKPHKYYPPFTVEFSDLSARDIAGDVLTLAGVSTHIGPKGAQAKRYEATCTLKVLRRLPYLPPASER